MTQRWKTKRIAIQNVTNSSKFETETTIF